MRRYVVLACPFAIAACGGTATPEAPDAGADAGVVGVPAHVAVHLDRVDDPTQPAVGIPIYFSNPDGSLAASETTDAGGNAHAIVGDGGSVTMYWRVTQEPHLLGTVMGVHDGDTIDLTMLGHHRLRPIGAMTMSVPAFAGARYYSFYDGCDQGTTPSNSLAQLQIFSCAQQPLDLVAVARDVNDVVIGSAELTGVVFQDGGKVTFPALTPAATFQVHYDGVDVAALGLEVERRSVGFGSQITQAPPAASSEDIAVPEAPAGYGGVVVKTTLERGAIGGAMIIDPISAQDTSYRLDLSTDLPAGGLMRTGPAFGSPTNTVTLAPPASFAGDFVYALYDVGGLTPAPIDWYMVAPPTVTSLTQPIIPLVGGDSELANITPELYLVDSAGFSDYDAHRATIARDVADLVRGSAGRVRALQ